MTRAEGYIGLARRAGLLETGEENAGIAVRAGKAKLLVLAADASENARCRAENFVFGRPVPLMTAPLSKEEISGACGKNGCSMIVFTDLGLADSFVSALAEADSGQFGALAQQMHEQKAREAMRKREALSHARNKKLGKRRKNV